MTVAFSAVNRRKDLTGSRIGDAGSDRMRRSARPVPAARHYRVALGLLATALAMGAAPAAAQGLSSTVYVGGSLPLSVPVTASVGGRCEFAAGEHPTGEYDAGAIDAQAWTHAFDFTISCNTASRVAVVSLNGALKTSPAVADAGYYTAAPYTVELELAGNTATSVQDCDASTLLVSSGTPCSFRGPASSTAGLRLNGPATGTAISYLRVHAPAYAGPGSLVSGGYSDTLYVTIAAAP